MEKTENRKRGALVMLAALLVCLVSVLATVAYLQTITPELRNTFKSAGVDGAIELLETRTRLVSGIYEKTGNPVDAEDVEYNLAPDVTIPKDTFVRVSDLSTRSYVYVAVNKAGFVGDYDAAEGEETLLTADLDTCWVPLMEDDGETQVAVAVNDGEDPWPVYVYAVDASEGSVVGPVDLWEQPILANQAIVVADYNGWTNLPSESPELDFRAYMSQVTSETSTPLLAWEAAITDGWDPSGE